MRALLAKMDPAAAERRSRAICRTVCGLEEFRRARAVMVYLPVREEVNTEPLVHAAWEAGKTVLAPKVYWKDHHMTPIAIHSLDEGLAEGSYGVREPIGGRPFEPEAIDMVLVPAVAYDLQGNRLGKGGGFYDRFLATAGLRARACGLAFDEQVAPELPVGPHDEPVGMLVTDTDVLRFTGESGSAPDSAQRQEPNP
jgi:5-formyltetrahydrofolate cyclo-ligase